MGKRLGTLPEGLLWQRSNKSHVLLLNKNAHHDRLILHMHTIVEVKHRDVGYTLERV